MSLENSSKGSPLQNKLAVEENRPESNFNARAYQVEMMEESLRRNTIVTMDTGSGKTHVAVLRIQAELELAASGKFVWFLTPTIALCLQQRGVLQSHIPSAQIKSFTSSDNVDRWSTKKVWDAVLTNVTIVVSTYKVLHDALSHAFVSIESLSLIVFDEAHNCNGRSPGSKIMQDFYWLEKRNGHPVPHILGLTASPIMGSDLNALETLETVLDATCRSPRIQKSDLLLHVKPPKLVQINFKEKDVHMEAPSYTSTMKSLHAVFRNLDILKDPQIIRMRSENSEISRNMLERALNKQKTFIQDQMKSFCRKSVEIKRSLGNWAADYYISRTTSGFIESNSTSKTEFSEWSDAEKRYLAKALHCVNLAAATTSMEFISDKVHSLVAFLRSCADGTIGILFVKERATAYVLYCILSKLLGTCSGFRFGLVVGSSKLQGSKRDIYEMSITDKQTKTLANFRSSKINMLIATSVLEEGIDVPRCNMVICFDEPANLKSYVQCRGRARLRESKFVMLLEKGSKNRTSEWEILEKEMKKRYEAEERCLHKLAELEIMENQKFQSRKFRVPSTGALLDMESAKGHLQFFCSHLSSYSCVQTRPAYIVIEAKNQQAGSDDPPLLKAKVLLPSTLDSSLRVKWSKNSWYSEKNAMKDAAFECYVSLYHAGLINEHLLPLSIMETLPHEKQLESIIEVQEQTNPWLGVAQNWKIKKNLQQRILSVKKQSHSSECNVEMYIPAGLLDMNPIPIYWDATTKWMIETGPPLDIKHSKLKPDHTAALLSLSLGHRWTFEDNTPLVLFRIPDFDFNHNSLGSISLINQDHTGPPAGLLRDLGNCSHPYIYHDWLSLKPSRDSVENPHKDYETFPGDQSFVALKQWPRRLDFLHEVAPDLKANLATTKPYFSVLPKSLLRMDLVPAKYSQLGLLIPSVLHQIEIQLIVSELCSTLLLGVEISNTKLIQAAISSPGAQEQDNYEKLAFLGDSVVKYLVTVFITSKYLTWPEGYLVHMKGKIVSNARLCETALEHGLPKFILSKPFTGKNWRPLCIENALEPEEKKARDMSSKTIADVVQAMIGAGWQMGRSPTALSILKVFLPEVDLPSLETAKIQLFDAALDDVSLPADLHSLEELAGYSFEKKSLLIQAMSHSSHSAATAAYERLEFLGDAIIEMIVMDVLFEYENELSLRLMHLYRAAIVNGSYLSFVALEWGIIQRSKDLKYDLVAEIMTEVESEFSLPLWRFMRHGSSNISNEQSMVEQRHTLLRQDILHAIKSGTAYPWAILANLQANRFFSDIVESLIGAVWVDSGSLSTCRKVMERMGILPHLHRLIRDRVHVLHPKEELSILAGSEKVNYQSRLQESDTGGEEWICTVYIGHNRIVEVSQGVCDDGVRTKAAQLAIALLKDSI